MDLVKRLLLWAVILIILVGYYFFYNRIPREEISNFIPEQGMNCQVKGRIISYPEIKNEKLVFILKVDSIEFEGQKIKVSGKTRTTLKKDEEILEYGDIILANGFLAIPGQNKFPGDFNWKKYLATQRIYSIFYINELEKIGEEKKFIFSLIYKIREKIKERFSSLCSPYNEILTGIVLGDKNDLPLEIKNVFQSSGVAHLLAVSGLHIGIIIFWIHLFFKLFKIYPLIESLFTICFLVFYVFLVGFYPSILRATIMWATLYFCKLSGQRYSSGRALILAGIIIFLLNPNHIKNIGFLLSFSAVGGIIISQKLIAPLVAKSNHFLRYLLNSFSISLGAQLAVLPVTAYYFNSICLIGIFTNFFAVPLASLILFFGLGSLFFPFLLPVNSILLKIFLKIISFFSEIPGASIKTFTPSISIILIYYLLFLLPFLLKFYFKKLKFIVVPFFILLFFNFYNFFPKGLELNILPLPAGQVIHFGWSGNKNYFLFLGSNICEIGELEKYVKFKRIKNPQIFDLKKINCLRDTHIKNLGTNFENFHLKYKDLYLIYLGESKPPELIIGCKDRVEYFRVEEFFSLNSDGNNYKTKMVSTLVFIPIHSPL